MSFKATNVGAELSVQGIKNSPAATAAVNGPWVAVNDLAVGKGGISASAKAFGNLANIGGTPTAASLVLKIQDATDSSGTGSADYKPDGVNTAQSSVGIVEAAPGAGTNDTCELNVVLKNARAYVRVVGTPGFTGGTSPHADVAVGFVFGGYTNNPTTTQNA